MIHYALFVAGLLFGVAFAEAITDGLWAVYAWEANELYGTGLPHFICDVVFDLTEFWVKVLIW